MNKLRTLPCLIVILLMTLNLFSQSQFSTNSTDHHDQKQDWKFSWEFSGKSKQETPNKVDLIDGPVTAYKAMFEKFTPNREFRLETTAGTSTKRNNNGQYFGFRSEVVQHFSQKVALTADTEFVFTNRQSFGRSGLQLSKRFQKEKFAITPFSKVDYYYPLGNGFRGSPYIFNTEAEPVKISNGFAWSNGLSTNVEYQPFIFENKTQLIFDTGTVFNTRRTLINTELFVGYRIGRLCIGPTFEYTNFAKNHSAHFVKNSLIGGLSVRYY